MGEHSARLQTAPTSPEGINSVPDTSPATTSEQPSSVPTNYKYFSKTLTLPSLFFFHTDTPHPVTNGNNSSCSSLTLKKVLEAANGTPQKLKGES